MSLGQRRANRRIRSERKTAYVFTTGKEASTMGGIWRKRQENLGYLRGPFAEVLKDQNQQIGALIVAGDVEELGEIAPPIQI
jgi:hypothetical protein